MNSLELYGERPPERWLLPIHQIPAKPAIAEIVHDIDLKDAKFGREQTPGIAQVISGICISRKDDLARIERGAALFNDLYEYFREKRS